MHPATSCGDCLKSEGNENTIQRFHRDRGHGGVTGDSMLQAWFLLMNGVFFFIMRELDLDSLSDLLSCAGTLGVVPKDLRFSEEEIVFLREYDRRAGIEPLTDNGYLVFPPTRIIAMSSHLVMMRLLSRLSDEAKAAFKTLVHYVSIDGSVAPKGHPVLKLGIIDSHFHMDRLSSRYLTQTGGLGDSTMTNPVRLIFGIANYAYQDSWHSIDRHLRFNPNLKFTIGVHPHKILANLACSLFNKLKSKLAQYPAALGIGEVGLDFTTSCRCHVQHDEETCRERKIEEQRKFLRLIFQFFKQHDDKVLVLHVRDNGDGTAAEEVLSLLDEYGLKNARIHRHCFVGEVEEYKTWKEKLPRCYFSISRKSLDTIGAETWPLLRENRDRLILETDAPYFAEREPVDVYKIAQGVARKTGLTLHELVRRCNRNVAKLYNLTW